MSLRAETPETDKYRYHFIYGRDSGTAISRYTGGDYECNTLQHYAWIGAKVVEAGSFVEFTVEELGTQTVELKVLRESWESYETPWKILVFQDGVVNRLNLPIGFSFLIDHHLFII